MTSSKIGDALFTKTQQKVLGILYGKPEQTFYLNEIVRMAAVGKGSVKRALDSFCDAGLLTVEQHGNQTHYQANVANPIFNELKSITQKTFGIADVIKIALEPLLTKVHTAFVYGSMAQGTAHGSSDIDLMIVADHVSYSDVMEKIESAEVQLGRTINPTVYSLVEFSERQNNNQNFIRRVMEQPKIWLVGRTDDKTS